MLGDARLVEIGQAISDGTPIDWDALAEGQNDAERKLLNELRVLAEIVDLHRKTNSSQPEAGDVVADKRRSAPKAGALPAEVTSVWEEQWGHLRLIEKLGYGAFGDVYRAWDSRLDREVALKLIKQRQSASPAATSSVIEEGRLLARVRHPNVVTVFGAERVGDRVGVWMELIQGRTLEDLVRERGTLSAREAMLIGIDLCRALSAVHRAGLLHRDIKPQNVMREDGGRIVLMDFGTGRERVQADGAVARDFAGTPLYLAPEILRAQSASAQSDIYSLGVLLFRVVSDGFPVRGRTLPEVKLAHERGDRTLLTDLRPDLPDALVQVIQRAIAFDPKQRYESPGAMEQALSSALALVPAEQTESPPVPVPSRRWLVGVTAGIAAVLLIATALIATGRWRPLRWFGGGSVQHLAVLPIRNLSGDSNQDMIADGITELLTTNLASIASLQVTASTSSRFYKDAKKTIPEIARELGVDYVVEGTMSGKGDQVWLIVRVPTADGDTRRFNRKWDRKVLDVLAFQGEIAQAIADGIAVTLTADERQRLAATSPPVSAAAQEAYLRGRFTLSGPPVTDRAETAVQLLEEAVRLDPDYALARADLADAYIRLANWSTVLPRSESVSRAKTAALKAMQLQPGLAGPYVSLARAQFYFDFDWPGAGASFVRALQLNPSHADAHEQYAYYLMAQGRSEAALAEATRARDLDPLNPTRTTTVGGILYYSRRYPEAIAQYQLALTLDSSFTTAYFVLGRAYAAVKQYDDAIANIERSLVPKREVAPLAELARVYAENGQPGQARQLLDEVDSRTATTTARLSADTRAYVHIALGEIDRAFELLQRAAVEKASGLLWLKVDPRVDRIRDDPRFASLLRVIGLQP